MRCTHKQPPASTDIFRQLIHILIRHTVPAKEYKAVIPQKLFERSFNRYNVECSVLRICGKIVVTIVCYICPFSLYPKLIKQTPRVLCIAKAPVLAIKLIPQGGSHKPRPCVVKPGNKSCLNHRSACRSLIVFGIFSHFFYCAPIHPAQWRILAVLMPV